MSPQKVNGIMIRFRMPNPELDRADRKKKLKEQMDAFIRSDALKSLLDALGTDIDSISQRYNARAQKSGKVLETQEIVSLPELRSRKDELYPLFEAVGFFEINKPVSSDYTRILILSASLKTTYLKTVCSANWVTPKVITVDALSCFRPINPVERINTGCSIDSDTEFGCASDSLSEVFLIPPDRWEDDFSGDRNLNSISCIRRSRVTGEGPGVRVFAAPSSEPSIRRADTGDTLKFYMENGGIHDGETLLAVTSNRYCNRQFLQLAYQIIKEDRHVGLDIIGNYGDDELGMLKDYDPYQYIQDVIAMIDWIRRFENDIRG